MSTGTKGQIAAGQAVIVVTIDNQIQNGLKKIESSVRKFASGIGQIGFDLFRGGLLGSIPVFASTKEFTEFEDEILRLGTKLQTTDKQLKRVEDRIRSLGKTTSFTALEVAQGATSLAQAGLKPTEVQSGLQSVLDLGRGAKITLDESADLLANTSATFKLPVSDFPEIASQFIAAARLSTIEVINLKEAIKEASGTLNDLNIDLPTSLALLSQLGFRSLKGTKAGTTLNTMLLNLVAKMKQIGKVLKIEVGNIDGTMRPILDVLDDFSKKIKELPETQRITLSQRLFNIRGSRGETALREIDKIRELAKEIKNAGNEARLAAIKMDSGLGGSVRRATSAINDLAISLGKNLSPHLIKLLDIVPALAASIDEIVQKFPLLTTLVLALPPGILAAGTGLLVLSFTLGKLASVLGLAGSAVGIVGKNLRNLGGDISSGVGKATLTSISLLGRLDKAIAVSIFGSGRGRRKRPKSIFAASLSGPQLGKKTFTRVSRTSSNILGLGSSVIKNTAASIKPIIVAIQQISKSINIAILRFVVLTKRIQAAQAQARNAATFIQANAVAVADRSKIYLMLERNILALKKKQLLATTVLNNAQAKVASTSQRALLYKKFVAIEKAYQTKVAQIGKQAARKQRLYGKPFLAKDAKELAALGKQRGKILSLVGKDTSLAKGISFAKFYQEEAVKAINALKRVKAAAAVTAKQTAAIPQLQALQARGFAQGGRLTQETTFLAKADKTARLEATKLKKIRLGKSLGFLKQLGLGTGKAIGGGLSKTFNAIFSGTKSTIFKAGKSVGSVLISGINFILKGKWISSLYKIFAGVGTSISLFLKSALGFGKFLFSFNGIFQILSLLLIFGDKMTFTKNILDSLGRGFVAFGRSIGDIGRLIGPTFSQISSGFSLILGGEGGRGIEQIVAGLQNMATIIINQVLAGFNRLIVEISPGLEFLYGFFKSLWELLKLVGSTAASLANPLQEIGKNNQSSLSDKLSEIFSLSNMVEGFKELGLYVEGFATALANLAVQGFSFLGTAIQFLTDTMAALLGAIRDLVQSRNFGGVFNSEVASLSAATATVFQGGLQLNRDLQNVSKEMTKVPELIAAAGTKFQEKMDTLEQEVAGSMKAAADARAKEQESIAKRIANEATLANLYNDLIRGISSLGAGALTAPQMSDNWSWARWDKIGNTGAEVLNRYTGKEINAEARSATKGINALGQLLPKPFIDGMKETLTNPTKTIGQGLAALANPLAALGNPLAEGAAAIGKAIADKATATTLPEMQGLYGAMVGSFQETRGTLMAVKTEPEKQTTLLKGIRRGLFDGEETADPLLKQIRDKDTTPKYE